MKKVIVGLVAVGAVVALRPVVKRMAHKMREHCEQMAAKCKQMTRQSGAPAEGGGMRERCEEMAAQHKEKMAQFGGRSEEAGEHEHPDPTLAEVGARA